ncbi:hypothetical protein [Fibrobacter sp. UWB12]|uniref:hypothetical protein n=1 Tax=Fibrobacter sp. UWB12 TaxID=1896203 RepID=UPI000912F3B3|nr:hypothetical protein [Fibrobacter sp. UWB12]SHK52588.1 hypothetical protein SAMN05720759_103261 [Fibrobacter sp. UWB12]
MMKRCLWLAFVTIFATSVMAKNMDYTFFLDRKGNLCVEKGKALFNLKGLDRAGNMCVGTAPSVRIRIMDAPADENSSTGIYLERPFMIVDGIDLNPDEKKTLTDLEGDVQQVGLPLTLKSLGYTPVLVQFTETVRTSLQENSKTLSKLFSFLSDNEHIPFPGAVQDGFVVMGISQGGVIGRYGAYLYDTHRSESDAPIRLFASLDSPHQGAVMPMGLFNTVAFWSEKGGSSAAEMFKDMLLAKGAADLLVYENSCEGSCKSTAKTKGRFLYEDYRYAAEYKKFPTVLVAQGQLKGRDPVHSNDYYLLERHAEKGPATLGSAVSHMHYSDNNGTVARNRIKETTDDAVLDDFKGTSRYDFIQGSTYPFAATIYNSLRQGFLDAMPNDMKKGILFWDVDVNTSWGRDELVQDRSTFIPTASAMDMKCNGELAIRSNCGFTQSYNGFPFENPGARSTATAAFAVDPTHPRYAEAISGRHIEMPFDNDTLNAVVLNGMQVDFWRILCEVAKYDYDYSVGQFRNPKLIGYFSPNTKCMDLEKMPDIIRNAGVVQTIPFAYARYDYNANATEKKSEVKFKVPAGWKKVAAWNYGSDVQANTTFEVNIKVENPKGNWMKAELLVCRTKFCSGSLQLNEMSVPVDGSSHTLRWQMPANGGALNGMRWFRLVLNSDGGDVTVSNAQLVLNTRGDAVVPPKISSASIYPSRYEYFPWDNGTQVKTYTDELGVGLELKFDRALRGMHIEMGQMVSMEGYSNLIVEHWPGTCQNTLVYFDSKKLTNANLANGLSQNGFIRKVLPLHEIIDLNTTPQGSKSAHRLNLQSVGSSDRCIIKSIMLE